MEPEKTIEDQDQMIFTSSEEEKKEESSEDHEQHSVEFQETAKESSTESKAPLFTDEQQSLIDGIIQRRLDRQNKKHQEELEAEKARFKDLQNKYEPGDHELEIPEMPDMFDEHYNEKMAKRDEIIQRKIKAQATQEARANFERDTYLAEQQRNAQTTLDKFKANALQAGLDINEIDADIQQKLPEICNLTDVAQFVMHRAKGPLIIKHFANNQADYHKLLQVTNLVDRSELLFRLENQLKVKKKQAPYDETRPPKGGGGTHCNISAVRRLHNIIRLTISGAIKDLLPCNGPIRMKP